MNIFVSGQRKSVGVSNCCFDLPYVESGLLYGLGAWAHPRALQRARNL